MPNFLGHLWVKKKKNPFVLAISYIPPPPPPRWSNGRGIHFNTTVKSREGTPAIWKPDKTMREDSWEPANAVWTLNKIEAEDVFRHADSVAYSKVSKTDPGDRRDATLGEPVTWGCDPKRVDMEARLPEPEIKGETKNGTKLNAPVKPNSNWQANDGQCQQRLAGAQVSWFSCLSYTLGGVMTRVHSPKGIISWHDTAENYVAMSNRGHRYSWSMWDTWNGALGRVGAAPGC